MTMIARVIEFSARHRAAVILAAVAAALGGWWSMHHVALDGLRSFKDGFPRYSLKSVRGAADVASLGGYVRQYQVDVDPNRLRAYNLPLSTVVEAVERSNTNVGGNVVEQAGQWAVVRGIGLIESVTDVENIVIGAQNGTPIYVKQ